jgi:hypothetical protein
MGFAGHLPSAHPGAAQVQPDEEGAMPVTSQNAPAGETSGNAGDQTARSSALDTSVAHPARIYDYWLGGKDNFAADRIAADEVIAANPNILPGVRANRAFLSRAVRFLAGQAGIRQFLDVGSGLPMNENTHQIAQQAAPESRVVYVDNDPIVLAHGLALLTSHPGGACDYIEASAQDTDAVLSAAAKTLDLSQPVAVMMLCILQYVPDRDQPHQIVSRLMDAVPPGSYLTVSDTTRDIDTERVAPIVSRLNTRLGPAQMSMRTRAEIAAYFDGLDFVEPGLVPLPEWRAQANPAHVIPCYAGIARKP